MPTPASLIRSFTYRSRHVFRHFHSREVWRRFRTAAKHYDVSTLWVFVRALQLYKAGRFLPHESLAKGLIDPAVPIETSFDHFSEERLHALQIAANSPNAEACRDKLLFHVYCEAHELPTPPLLGVLSPHGSRDGAGRLLAGDAAWDSFVASIETNIVAKPRNGKQGRDIERITVDVGEPRHPEGSASPPLERLRCNLREDYILEECLVAHEDIQKLTGSRSISAVRIITCVNPAGEVRLLDAYFRLVVGDSVTDNISDPETGLFSGNILATPNLDSGSVESAWAPNADGVGYSEITRHPGTGREVIGFTVPDWSEVRALVIKAATAFVPIRVVGWDVAITPSGPVLIEANERFKHSASGGRVWEIRRALAELG